MKALTNSDKATIMQMHKEGKTGVEIADFIGFSSAAVCREIRIMTGVFKPPETNRITNYPINFDMNSSDFIDYAKHGAPFIY